MTTPSITADELRAAILTLRAFAMSLCGNRDYADDLVQDTLVRAWGKMDRFEAGTNLHAWLSLSCGMLSILIAARGGVRSRTQTAYMQVASPQFLAKRRVLTWRTSRRR
jgi:hypothetical protein